MTIDVSKYPLFMELSDPEGVIKSILDREYSIFKSQHKAHLHVDIAKQVSDICSQQQDSISAMDELLDKLPLLLQGSKSKGNVGEQCLMSFLKETLNGNDYVLEDMSKTSHSGDICVSKKSFSCLLDSKHYRNKLPSKEVDKLKNDMVANNIRCGVLVNYDNGISKYRNTDLEFFEVDGVLYCLAVLGNAKENPLKIVLAIHYLEVIFERMIQTSIRPTTFVEGYDELLSTADDVQKLIKKFEESKRCVENTLNEFQTQLMTAIMNHITSLKIHMKSRSGTA
jgi:hypothetical protein